MLPLCVQARRDPPHPAPASVCWLSPAHFSALGIPFFGFVTLALSASAACSAPPVLLRAAPDALVAEDEVVVSDDVHAALPALFASLKLGGVEIDGLTTSSYVLYASGVVSPPIPPPAGPQKKTLPPAAVAAAAATAAAAAAAHPITLAPLPSVPALPALLTTRTAAPVSVPYGPPAPAALTSAPAFAAVAVAAASPAGPRLAALARRQLVGFPLPALPAVTAAAEEDIERGVVSIVPLRYLKSVYWTVLHSPSSPEARASSVACDRGCADVATVNADTPVSLAWAVPSAAVAAAAAPVAASPTSQLSSPQLPLHFCPPPPVVPALAARLGSSLRLASVRAAAGASTGAEAGAGLGDRALSVAAPAAFVVAGAAGSGKSDAALAAAALASATLAGFGAGREVAGPVAVVRVSAEDLVTSTATVSAAASSSSGNTVAGSGSESKGRAAVAAWVAKVRAAIDTPAADSDTPAPRRRCGGVILIIDNLDSVVPDPTSDDDDAAASAAAAASSAGVLACPDSAEGWALCELVQELSLRAPASGGVTVSAGIDVPVSFIFVSSHIALPRALKDLITLGSDSAGAFDPTFAASPASVSITGAGAVHVVSVPPPAAHVRTLLALGVLLSALSPARSGSVSPGTRASCESSGSIADASAAATRSAALALAPGVGFAVPEFLATASAASSSAVPRLLTEGGVGREERLLRAGLARLAARASGSAEPLTKRVITTAVSAAVAENVAAVDVATRTTSGHASGSSSGVYATAGGLVDAALFLLNSPLLSCPPHVAIAGNGPAPSLAHAPQSAAAEALLRAVGPPGLLTCASAAAAATAGLSTSDVIAAVESWLRACVAAAVLLPSRGPAGVPLLLHLLPAAASTTRASAAARDGAIAATAALAAGAGAGVGSSDAGAGDGVPSLADLPGFPSLRAELASLAGLWRDGDSARRLGASAPRGLLLWGAGGGGKTWLAQAVAAESGLPVMRLGCADVFQRFLGESEKVIRTLFKRAAEAAPCVVVIDEIDVIAPNRSANSASTTGVESRILSTLLNELDGVEARSGVFLLATSRSRAAVDAALLRPGRLDRVVEVPAPTLEDAAAVARWHLRRAALAPDVDIDDVVKTMCRGYTCARIAALCRGAISLALQHAIALLEASPAKNREAEAEALEAAVQVKLTHFTQARITV